MDIRTKLVFALVSVSLASMFALGLVTYRAVEIDLRERRVAQLEGVADLKAAAVERVVAGWMDRVALVASRSEVRVGLAEYEGTGSAAAAARIEQQLNDAAGASALFRELAVYGADGRFVTGSGARTGPLVEPRPNGVTYRGARFGEDGRVSVVWDAPVMVDTDYLGTVRAVLGAGEIARLSLNYAGLGETGETLVVEEAADGTVRALHPVRFPPEGRGGGGLVVDGDGALRALGGDEIRTTGQLIDYRGVSVWAATRRIASPGWGIVVKLDESEHVEPIADIRDDMIRLAVTLAAFAIALGTFVGIRFAQPITRLAEAAEDIGEGKLETRSGIDRRDEVGLLARTFDEMAERLQTQVGLLDEYRLFFDRSIDLLCMASTDGYFKEINEAFVRELGWPEEKLLSVPFMDMVHPDDRDATRAEIERLAAGSPTIRFTNRFECADGSYKRLRWNAYPDPNSGRLYAIARVRGRAEGATS